MYSSSYQLKYGDTLIGDTKINIPKDQFLKSAKYIPSSETLQFTFDIFGDDGFEETTTNIPVSDLVHEYEGGDGINVNYEHISGSTYISIKTASAETNDNKFINLTDAGLGLSGITDYVSEQLDALAKEFSGYIAGVSGEIVFDYKTADNTLSATLSSAVTGYVKDQFDALNGISGITYNKDNKQISIKFNESEDNKFINLTDSGLGLFGITDAFTTADNTLSATLSSAVTGYVDVISSNIVSAYQSADNQLKADLTNYVTGLIIPSGDSIKTTSNLNYITTAESVSAFVDEKINTIAPEFEIITEDVTEDVPYNRIRITEISNSSAKAEFIQSGNTSSVSLSKEYTNSINAISDETDGYLVTVKAVKDYYESQIEGLKGQIEELRSMINNLQAKVDSKINS